MSVEITNEPPPPPQPGPRVAGGVHINLIKESTGEVIQEVESPDYFFVNEKRLRQTPKY